MTPEIDRLCAAYRSGYEVGLQLGRDADRSRTLYKARKKAHRKLGVVELRAWHHGYNQGTLVRELKNL